MRSSSVTRGAFDEERASRDFRASCARADDGMGRAEFVRFCRDRDMFSKSEFTHADAVKCFAKLCPRASRGLNFIQFLDALDAIAWCRRWSAAQLEEHLSGKISTVEQALSAARGDVPPPPPPRRQVATSGGESPSVRVNRHGSVSIARPVDPIPQSPAHSVQQLITQPGPRRLPPPSERDTEERIATLEETVRKCLPLVHEVKRLGGENSQLAGENTRLLGELNVAQRESAARGATLAQRSAALQAQQRELDALAEANAQLRGTSHGAEAHAAERQRSAQLTELLHAASAEISKLTERAAVLRSAVDGYAGDARATELARTVAQDASAQANVRIAVLELELSAAAARRAPIEAAEVRANERIALLEDRLARSAETEVSLQRELHALRLTAAEAELKANDAAGRELARRAERALRDTAPAAASPAAVRVNRHGSISIAARPEASARDALSHPAASTYAPKPSRMPTALSHSGGESSPRAAVTLRGAVQVAFSAQPALAEQWGVPDLIVDERDAANVPVQQRLRMPMLDDQSLRISPLEAYSGGVCAPSARTSEGGPATPVIPLAHVSRHGSISITTSDVASGAPAAGAGAIPLPSHSVGWNVEQAPREAAAATASPTVRVNRHGSVLIARPVGGKFGTVSSRASTPAQPSPPPQRQTSPPAGTPPGPWPASPVTPSAPFTPPQLVLVE